MLYTIYAIHAIIYTNVYMIYMYHIYYIYYISIYLSQNKFTKHFFLVVILPKLIHAFHG